jgi:hypothetical protein
MHEKILLSMIIERCPLNPELHDAGMFCQFRSCDVVATRLHCASKGLRVV